LNAAFLYEKTGQEEPLYCAVLSGKIHEAEPHHLEDIEEDFREFDIDKFADFEFLALAICDGNLIVNLQI
jgi:hypothetical protein